ncbi:MAG: anion permease [Acidobacteria bacterium]|nr:anion permease [Acidobacteriota bacterium]
MSSINNSVSGVAEGVRLEAWPVKRILGVLAAVSALLILWFLPLGLEPRLQHSLAVAAFMIVLWGTEAFDVGVTGILGCYLFWVLGIANPALAFGGFANDTTWFMLGALLIGAMTHISGLGRRIGYVVISRAGTKYSRILLALIIADFLLAFIVPSGVARVVIMAAVGIGLINAFEAKRGSNIARGIFIMFTYSATIFDKMLIANPPAILARGIIETVGHVPVRWSHWFIAYLPCDLITILVCWRVALWLYPPEVKELPGGKDVLKNELARMGPWTLQEKKCLLLVLTAVALWMTDSFHHINPSIIGVGVGLAALLPGVGFMTREDFRNVNLSVFFLVGGAISMTNVLINTKAIEVMTKVMFSWMTPLITSVYHSTVVLYWTAFVYHIFLAVETSMLATSMPPLMQFALDKGFNPLVVGMIWTFAAGGKIFIYQAAGVITGYSYGYFTARDVFKVGLILTLVESIILFFLVPFYWPLIGLK